MVLLNTIYPLVVSRRRPAFRFLRSMQGALETRPKGGTLLVLEWPADARRYGKPLELLERLREHYDSLIYFDNTPQPAKLNYHALRLCDRYVKKHLLRDRELYRRPLYGGTLFSDYYHRAFGVEDAKPRRTPAAPDDLPLEKLQVGWNIGIGGYPRVRLRKGLARRLEARFGARALRLAYLGSTRMRRPVARAKESEVSARYSYKIQSASVLYQRTLFAERIAGHPACRTGLIAKDQYFAELRRALLTLSPFGRGEVCFRDFEAVLQGSALLKPDMSHIETWPNIYLPDETYAPLRWDGADLTERIDALLADPQRAVQMARNAQDALSDCYRRLDERVEAVLGGTHSR